MKYKTQKSRQEPDPPMVSHEWGWRYHHMGIPTAERKPGERYIAHLKMYVSGFDTSPYGVEWMRFEAGSPVDPLIQRVPHVAFEVDDIDQAIVGKELIGDSSYPSAGVKVAMIKHNGAPIELIQFGTSD